MNKGGDAQILLVSWFLRSWRGSLGDWGAVALVVRPVLEPEWAWMCHRPDLPLSELLLDALASLDFKMSLSEWVSDSPFSNFFTASASTGLSELLFLEPNLFSISYFEIFQTSFSIWPPNSLFSCIDDHPKNWHELNKVFLLAIRAIEKPVLGILPCD